MPRLKPFWQVRDAEWAEHLRETIRWKSQLCGSMLTIGSFAILLSSFAAPQNAFEAAAVVFGAYVTFNIGAFHVWLGTRLGIRLKRDRLFASRNLGRSGVRRNGLTDARRRTINGIIHRMCYRFAGGSLLLVAWVLLAAALHSSRTTFQVVFSIVVFASCFAGGLLCYQNGRRAPGRDSLTR